MIKLFKRLQAKEILMVVLSVIFIMTQVWLDLKIPEYMTTITQKLQTPGATMDQIMEPGMEMILMAVLSLCSAVVTGFFAARIASSFTTRLRKDVFETVIDYSTAELNHFSVPSLLTRTTNDITQIQMLIAMGLQVVVKGPIMALWAIRKIADKNVEWLWATVVAVALMVTLIVIILVFAFPRQRKVQKMTDKVNAVTRESLIGVRVVRAYNAETYQEDKFDKANTDLTNLNLFISRLMALMNPVIQFIVSGLSLAIYWIGAVLIDQAQIMDKLDLYSDMIVFSSYALQVVFGIMMMLFVFFLLPRSAVSAGRINEVLDLKTSVAFGDQEDLGDKRGQVVFDHVSFAYSDGAEKVIEDVSFVAEPGQTVAFIGSTGSGKSTLVNLLPRFYDATEGQILVNGKDIKAYSHETLNKIVGYIPQKAVLFSGTIASNLEFGKSLASPLSDQDKAHALELAQAADFVAEKEEGINSEVAQGGTNFSGGQRQRLAIARALARKSDILIFDDSFSALDYKTDKTLRHALAEETQNLTKLIVAQRISTIMDAARIVVLDKGKVVGQGTHKELLATNEVYREIAYSQLSKEELEHA